MQCADEAHDIVESLRSRGKELSEAMSVHRECVMEVLFESRIEIESVAGKLRAIQAQPQYHPEVVVPRDTFVDRAGTSIWGTVLKDGGRFACDSIWKLQSFGLMSCDLRHRAKKLPQGSARGIM